MRTTTLNSFFAAAIFSALVAIPLWQVANKEDRSFALEVTARSTTAGTIQVYYDSGSGFSEPASSRAELPATKEPVVCRLALPAGTYTAFRLDPIDRDGTVILQTVRIVGTGHHVIREIALGDFQAINDIQSLRHEAGQLEAVVVPGHSDPQLLVEFRPRVVLSMRSALVGALMSPLMGVVFVLMFGFFVVADRHRAAGDSNPGVWRRMLSPPLGVILIACAAILIARRPESFSNAQFWGDDGHFYAQAYARGAHVMTMPWAGYHHLVARIVAALALHVDPARVPTFFTICGCALSLYVAARTQSARSPLPRLAACAYAVVLVPDAFEVLDGVVNAQWVLAGGLLLLLVSTDPRNGWEWTHDIGAAVLLSLEGPYSVFLLPLFAARALTRRTKASVAILVLVAICAAVQGWCIAHEPPPPYPGERVAWEAALAVPGMRILASLFAGYLVPLDYSRIVETLLGVAMFAGLAALAVRKGGVKSERVWMACAVITLLVGSLYRIRFNLPDLCHVGFGSRYFIPLQIFCIWLLLIATQDKRRWVARGTAALLIWALAINAPRLRENAFVDLHWGDYAPRIRAGEAVTVPINPPGWEISFPARPH